MKPATLRLLMTADAVGGVWQYATDLARALAHEGVRTRLAILGPPPSAAQRSMAGAIAGLTLIETGEQLDWLASDAAAVAQAGDRIADLARHVEADVVHLNMPALAASARFPAPTIAVAHSCLGTWWDAVRGDGLPADFAWRDRLHAEGLRRADLVITPSHSFARATQARHGLIRAPEVVYNGRDALPVPPRAMHDFAFTAGRLWDEGKNVRTLDRAASRLGIPFKAAGNICGPGGEAETFEHLCLLGQLDEHDLGRWLGARPIFASAASYEPFGLAVLEAAAAGCPLVLSDIPTFRELWEDVALFVASRDDAGFAVAIDELIGDAGRRIEWGERARQRAQHYAATVMARSMLASYRAVLERAGRRVAA